MAKERAKWWARQRAVVSSWRREGPWKRLVSEARERLSDYDAYADHPLRWQHVRRGANTDFWKFSIPRAFGDAYLLYYPEGGGVGSHVDPLPYNLWGGMLRLNIVLRQPQVGGVFHVETPECALSFGPRISLFRPDDTFHWVTPVGEGEDRWVFSLGFWLPSEWLAQKVLGHPDNIVEPEPEFGHVPANQPHVRGPKTVLSRECLDTILSIPYP